LLEDEESKSRLPWGMELQQVLHGKFFRSVRFRQNKTQIRESGSSQNCKRLQQVLKTPANNRINQTVFIEKQKQGIENNLLAIA
jgi:hypothetical protein